MRSCLVGITLLVLGDVFCASLPLPFDVQVEGDMFESIRAVNKREIDGATYMKNAQIRKERKAANAKRFLETKDVNNRVEREVNEREIEEAKERVHALESTHYVREEMAGNQEKRKRREASIAKRPGQASRVRRSYSRDGKIRVRITDENGQHISFRKRRSR